MTYALEICLKTVRSFTLVLFACVFCTLGCNTSELVPVSGVVTLEGTPVSMGRIEFHPSSGRPATGKIGGDGRYHLTTYKDNDGAKPGKYRVSITSRILPDADGPIYKSFEDEMRGIPTVPEKSKKSDKNSGRFEWIVPEIYSDQASSDLVAEVKHESGDINFELKSNR